MLTYTDHLEMVCLDVFVSEGFLVRWRILEQVGWLTTPRYLS